MKIENILFWVIALSMLAWACTKELPPSFLAGKYKAFNFVVQDCNDTMRNYDVDFDDLSAIYKINCIVDTIGCDTTFNSDSIFTRVDTFDSIGLDSFYIRFDSIRFTPVIACDTVQRDCDFVQFNEITIEIDLSRNISTHN